MANVKFRVTSTIIKEIENLSYAETRDQIQEILEDDPITWDVDLVDNAIIEILDYECDKPEPDDEDIE